MAIERTIQHKISKGYGKAARHLGHPFIHFVPQGINNPLDNLNMFDTLNVAFDPRDNFEFGKPAEYNDNVYYGLVDLTTVNIGDYFSDFDQYIFFVGNFEPLKPSMLVRCNRTITLYGPAANSSVSNGYGSDTTPSTKMIDWPVAISEGGIGGVNEDRTPGSISNPGVTIMVPDVVQIEVYDIIVDDLNRRFEVSGNELTGLGYFLTCRYVTA